MTETKSRSVQGKWNETLWNQFPKHLMEPKIEIPYTIVEPKPDRPIRDKKVRPHRYTSIIRKKYATEDEHK